MSYLVDLADLMGLPEDEVEDLLNEYWYEAEDVYKSEIKKVEVEEDVPETLEDKLRFELQWENCL